MQQTTYTQYFDGTVSHMRAIPTGINHHINPGGDVRCMEIFYIDFEFENIVGVTASNTQALFTQQLLGFSGTSLYSTLTQSPGQLVGYYRNEGASTSDGTGTAYANFNCLYTYNCHDFAGNGLIIVSPNLYWLSPLEMSCVMTIHYKEKVINRSEFLQLSTLQNPK